MKPIRSSRSGYQAFYHTHKGSLHGLDLYEGKEGHTRPRMMLTCGINGSGKSVGAQGLLTQTDPYADVTVLIDIGNSHGDFIKVMSEGQSESLVIEVGSRHTVNYFDPSGLPFSSKHLHNVVATAHAMAGEKSDEDANRLRAALLEDCVLQFFSFWHEQWLKKKPSRRRGLVNILASLRCFAEKREFGESLTDAYVRFRDECQQGGEAFQSFDEKVIKAEIDDIEAEGESAERDLMALSFTRMSREEMPTHTDFCTWFSDRRESIDCDSEEARNLLTLLKVWCAGGSKGKLFDGVNTIDLNAKYVHIELGRIGEGGSTLKAIASYVIASKVRDAMMLRPRRERKRVVIEEIGGFAGMQGGEEILKDFFERGRKYNIWTCAIIQQVSSLPERLSRSILGNCRLGWFCRQSEERDLKALQSVFNLPDAALDIIRSFPEPNLEHGAPFLCYEDLGGGRKRLTPCFDLATPEMLYVSGSSGEHYDARQKALAKHDDIIEGVLIEAHKQ